MWVFEGAVPALPVLATTVELTTASAAFCTGLPGSCLGFGNVIPAAPDASNDTVLLSILGLLDTPTDGRYLLDGEPAMGLTASQRAYIRNRQIGDRNTKLVCRPLQEYLPAGSGRPP